ncbi:GDP-L-fucose synthase [Mucilaginibacter corticis]|uniref:GDP-L-fucose synthase n=1 Tax=Mucilaginibacter corticis TaxID=2597670 RepID=A0A556MK65_9SPHI|nr:GDP-L-fucose synthase [Mucilaginibacter corticis]TSJ40301.1 GDP-L-fucose synthase [Mucilaginibacter corticis]
MIEKKSRIFIAGHKGMVGSAIERLYKKEGFTQLILKDRKELDLSDTNAVKEFFLAEKPEYVILAAAKVGGIQANMNQPVEFLYENLLIQNNIIKEAYSNNVTKLVFLGSSCIYPRECPQPMKEEYLLTGKLEPTNEGYALAKIVGIKLLESYYKEYGFNSISLMPCNLYGTNDSFHPQHAHVLSSLVRKFTDAVDNGINEVEVWGNGSAMREFMHVDDVARAVLYLMQNYNNPDFINIGWGTDISIKELAELIAHKVGFKGNIKWDTSKPNGMPRKCMDVSKMRGLGFSPCITIEDGIQQTINEYRELKLKNTI